MRGLGPMNNAGAQVGAGGLPDNRRSLQLVGGIIDLPFYCCRGLVREAVRLVLAIAEELATREGQHYE